LNHDERDRRKKAMAYVLFEPCHQPQAMDTADMSGMSADDSRTGRDGSTPER
jgi:hypothetical protein